MANNRLPYGLCKKYGIELPDGATPKDAWEALKKSGIGHISAKKIVVLKPNSPKFTFISGHYSAYSTLTKDEIARWFEAVGEVKRGMWKPSYKGLSCIQLGRKIAFTDADYVNPRIEALYDFKTERLADLWLEEIY